MNKTVQIYYREKSLEGGAKHFLWAWKDSIDANVFGRAQSLAEIIRRAGRMFPDCDIELLCS